MCNTPPPGYLQGYYGACVFSPGSYAKYGSGEGQCSYSWTPEILVCGNGDKNNHIAPLAPYMALGENESIYPWRGAASNGGTSLAIVHMSYGMLTPWVISEWKSLFGGVSLYAGMMNTWSDTADSAEFGYAVAQPFQANPNSSVVQDYVNAISSIRDGLGCGSNGYSYTGGFNGCGCHSIVTFSGSQNGAATTIWDSWSDLQNYTTLQSGASWYAWNLGCNYNQVAYNWTPSGGH